MRSVQGWILCLIIIGTNVLNVVVCYDTGHHADLTRNAMDLLGYSQDAQAVGAISNWMVDYFAYTIGSSEIVELNALHFDNLQSLQNVSNYFNTLAVNTKAAIESAAQKNDILAYLSIVGLTSHAVQDFYTHSSWAELHQSVCGCYRDDTWWSAVATVNGSIPQLVRYLQSISTYSWGDECAEFQRNCEPGLLDHGDYCYGINKDSYVRPRWESSYGFGFAGTYEWIYNIARWANNPDFVDAALNYTVGADHRYDLERDVEDSILISYAAKTPQFLDGDDGHWKGPGSGDYERLAAADLEFNLRESIFRAQFTDKHVYLPIVTPNPYDVPNGVDTTYSSAIEFIEPYYDISPSLRNFTKVKVRTMSVKVEDRLNTPSPYALVVIDGQEFEEAIQHDSTDFEPHWTAVRYIHAWKTSIDITYTLMNDKFPTDDEEITISDTTKGDGVVRFQMDVYSHRLMGTQGTVLNGTYDNANNLYRSTDGTNAVQFYVTQQRYGGCQVTGWPEQLTCPDEAYTQYLLHGYCNQDDSAATLASSIFMDLLRVCMVLVGLW